MAPIEKPSLKRRHLGLCSRKAVEKNYLLEKYRYTIKIIAFAKYHYFEYFEELINNYFIDDNVLNRKLQKLERKQHINGVGVRAPRNDPITQKWLEKYSWSEMANGRFAKWNELSSLGACFWQA